MIATLLREFEIRSTFFVNSFYHVFSYFPHLFGYLSLALAEIRVLWKIRVFLSFLTLRKSQFEFRFPQFGGKRRGGRITLTHSRKTLDQNDVWIYERQSCSCKSSGKTTPAATTPIANAHANAVVLDKIENLIATFGHRRTSKTSSRFLSLITKGNDKIYQTP